MPTYTAPTPRSTGYLVTAGNWNSELVDNMLYFKDAPVFDTAVVIGSASTAGIRLDLESGALAVREGDDTGYGPMNVGAITTSGALLLTANDAAALGSSTVAWSDLFLASGGVINFANGDVTITHSADVLAFAGAATAYTFATGAVRPSADDGAALGASGTAWSDLFLASGGVVNFSAGDTTITQSSGKLTIGGSGAGALDVKGAISPTANDGAALGASGTGWADLFLASGGIVDFGAGNTTITQSSGKLTIGGSGAGALDVKGAVSPTANDGAALGVSGTAWSDLFLASGGVVDFGAGNTTITQSAGKLTIGGSGAGALDVKGAISPTANDGAALGVSGTAWADLFLASGGVIDFAAGDTTITQSAGKLTIGGSGAGALDVKGAISPTANDGAALGVSGTAWSDLFLASGSVVNFNNGDVTITHAADTLTLAGASTGYVFSDGPVTVTAGTASAPAITTSGDLNTGVFFPAADTIAMTTGGTDRLRIDAYGNVLLGYTEALASALGLEVARDGAGQIGLSRFSTDANSGSFLIRKSRGTQASPTAVATNDTAGNVSFMVYGGTSYTTIANINAGVPSYVSNSSITGDMRFSTASASTLTERFRITSAGYIAIPSGSRVMLDGVGGGGDTYITESSANNIAIFTGGSERLRLDGSGNVGVNVTSFGTSAAGVLAVKNGTEPTTGPADTVQIYSVDRSAGNTIPAIYCEGSGVTNAGITSTTVTNKIALKVNGTIYYLLATTNAT